MIYLGSKKRIAKEILPIILKDRKPGQMYVEPFAGGCNMIDKVDNPRIGSDINVQIYTLIVALQEGWIPPQEVSEELYDRVHAFYDHNWYIKNWIQQDKPWRKQYMSISERKHYSKELVAYIGFSLSYAGKWWGGYRRDKKGKIVNNIITSKQNYAKEAFNNIMSQIPSLVGIDFHNKSYIELTNIIPPNSIIYCDPPYEGRTGYGKASHGFDHIKFWNWCTQMSNAGHIIFISEYQAPNNFTTVWQKSISLKVANAKKQSSKNIEKLFTI